MPIFVAAAAIEVPAPAGGHRATLHVHVCVAPNFEAARMQAEAELWRQHPVHKVLMGTVSEVEDGAIDAAFAERWMPVRADGRDMPKDQAFLVAGPHNAFSRAWFVGGELVMMGPAWQPTHWQPAPPLPTQPAVDTGERES